jgi:hypothetical protein
MSYAGSTDWTPGPGAKKLWPFTGNFSSRGLTPAMAASTLQTKGYTNEGLALAVAYGLPARLISSLAQAAGAQAEKQIWTGPVTGGFTLPGLPSFSMPEWTKWIPWIAGGAVALYLLPFLVKRKS